MSNAVIMAVSRAYLKRLDFIRYTLSGEQMLTSGLGRSILHRMNFVKRKVTETAKKIPADFDQLCHNFYSKIQTFVIEHGVPDELIVNWDQTSVNLVPSSNIRWQP